MPASAQQKQGLAPEDFYQLRTLADPDVSPDGKLVAFVVNGVDRKQNRRTSSIWVAPADGSEPAWQFSTVQSARGPQWSPDGRQMAFLSARPDADASASAPAPRSQVYVLRLDGHGEARKITDLKEGVDAFAWSPDGTRLACIGKTAPAEKAMTEPKREKSDLRHYRHSVYKADGVGYDDGKRGQVWVVEVASGVSKQLTAEEERSASGEAAWSPDGTRIAFLSQRTDTDVEENADVWVVPAAGGRPTKVSDTGFRVGPPRWSPDGQRIAYVAAKDWDAIPKIRIAPASGGPSVILADDLTFVNEIEWSGDGRSLFAALPVKGEEHLLRVDVATGRTTAVIAGPRAARRPDINEETGIIAYIASDVSHPDEVYVQHIGANDAPSAITRINAAIVEGRDLPGVERLTYKSLDGWDVDGFLIKPVGWVKGAIVSDDPEHPRRPQRDVRRRLERRFPGAGRFGLCRLLHEPARVLGLRREVPAGGRGEWGGKAYEDIMRGVDAVLAKHSWIDRGRLGVTGQSYGGFMTDWIVGQTDRFKAAVSLSGISNFVSVEGTRDGFYGHAKDFGGDLFDSFDTYWKYSPLRNVGRVKTPVLDPPRRRGPPSAAAPGRGVLPRAAPLQRSLRVRGVSARTPQPAPRAAAPGGRHGVDAVLVQSVCGRESRCDPAQWPVASGAGCLSE